MAFAEIRKDEEGNPVQVVLDWADYVALNPQAAEMYLSDEELYDKAKAEGGEYFPEEVVDALLDGENPVRVYRKYRGMTQARLAETIGHKQEYISQIETGKRSGSVETIKALAAVLSVDVDDLV